MVDGQTAIITGSVRGIGFAIAQALAEANWQIVLNDITDLTDSLSTLRSIQSESIAIQADITSATDRELIVSDTLKRFGRIDLLVNNAGIAPRQRVDMLEVSEQSFDEVMTINLKGPFFLTQLVAREMISLGKSGKISQPKIINISSLSAYTSSPSRAEYCLSKAGVSMMTKLWADRLAQYGIHVYEIRPGVIQTAMTVSVKEKYDHLIFHENLTPIPRWGLPEDIAKAVAGIAQGMLPFSTGEVINVDGGFHLRRL